MKVFLALLAVHVLPALHAASTRVVSIQLNDVSSSQTVNTAPPLQLTNPSSVAARCLART